MPTIESTSEDARVYEFCVLYPSNLSQKEENDLLKSVESAIEENGAKQIAKDAWGKRGLAYDIKGNSEGNYIVYHYEVEPQHILEIDENIRILPGVLRHLIVKPPKGYEIVQYSEKYAQWLKERESEDEKKRREKEEKLQKKVAEKARRQAKRTATKKEESPEEQKPKADKKKLSEELDKLISDDDLDI